MKQNEGATSWETAVTLSDVASADAIAIMLRGEGLPAVVVSDSALLGEARRSEVRVPEGVARRARWLMAQAEFSDAELTFLATGEFPGKDDAKE